MGNLVNGREYVFEVRAVNGLGKGEAETVRATPERRIAPPRPPPAPRPPGNGDGGGLLFPPEAPAGLMALPGDGTVRLEWGPPESDGGAPILRYEYRLKEGLGEFGEWTPIADSAPGEVNASGYTVGGLFNGTVYVFELRAVNLVGDGRVSEAVEVVMLLDRVYWSNFGAEDLQGSEAGLEHTPFGGTPRSLRLRFGAGLRFEESELDGEGEVTGTRSGELRVPLHQPDHGGVESGLRRGGGLRAAVDLQGSGSGQLQLSLRRKIGRTGELPDERAEPGAGDHQRRGVRGSGEPDAGGATGGGGPGRGGRDRGIRHRRRGGCVPVCDRSGDGGAEVPGGAGLRGSGGCGERGTGKRSRGQRVHGGGRGEERRGREGAEGEPGDPGAGE